MTTLSELGAIISNNDTIVNNNKSDLRDLLKRVLRLEEALVSVPKKDDGYPVPGEPLKQSGLPVLEQLKEQLNITNIDLIDTRDLISVLHSKLSCIEELLVPQIMDKCEAAQITGRG